jgi:hypothetical protein
MRTDERDDDVWTVEYIRIQGAIQVSRHQVGSGMFEWLIDFTGNVDEDGVRSLKMRVLTNARQEIDPDEFHAVFSVWGVRRPTTLTDLELLLRDSSIPESFEMYYVNPHDYARAGG